MRLISDYRDDKIYRNKYFDFLNNIFPSCDFKAWYDHGFWSNDYKTFSITDDKKIVSNVSISIMDVFLDGELKRAIQLGAVGTLSNFRNKGLSRYLMEHVIKTYGKQVDLMFLFANESVLNFYTKFGFKQVDQFIFSKKNDHSSIKGINIRKLNIGNKKDYQFLIDSLRKRIPVTKLFGALNYSGISMWHIFNFHRNNLFYIDHLNAIIIGEIDAGILKIYEIICDRRVDLNNISAYFEVKIEELIYYFPPDQFSFDYDKRKIFNDSPLFIKENSNFATDSVKFPETAVT